MTYFHWLVRLFVSLLMFTGMFSAYAKGHNSDYTSHDENQFYQALVAEMYYQSKDSQLALKHYLPIALKSDDPDLLKRVTEIATGSAQLKKGLETAKHWAKLSPDSLEAQQYFTLLLLRDGQLKQSALQLNHIRGIVDRDLTSTNKDLSISKGLKFIGALLVAESHHEKAYSVFSTYLSQLSEEPQFNDQKNLILASLGMKAKEYEAVVSAIDTIKLAGSQYFASAAVMKTKALRKLGRIEEATELLQQLVMTKKISDSLRLELTRLLVRVGKKEEAQQELEKLVAKYPENNDLLKALIALNITQREWSKAKTNNEKLIESKDYKNEAYYFFGEISEGNDNLREALSFYKKVKKGAFLKKSYSKRARLVTQLEGLEIAKVWLSLKHEQSSKTKDKIYWLKLEADLLSDSKLSLGLDSSHENLAQAIELYDSIINLSPREIKFRYHRGLLFERTSQIDKAEKDFKSVIRRGVLEAEALNALGYMLVEHTERFVEAKAFVSKAYKLKPNDPTILDSLGWVLYRTGEYKKAEVHLRKAFKKLKTPEVASHLIAVLSEIEKHEEARKIFNAMIKKYPNNASLDDVRSDLEHI